MVFNCLGCGPFSAVLVARRRTVAIADGFTHIFWPFPGATGSEVAPDVATPTSSTLKIDSIVRRLIARQTVPPLNVTSNGRLFFLGCYLSSLTADVTHSNQESE